VSSTNATALQQEAATTPRRSARSATAIAVGIVLVVGVGCSSNKENRESEQNAKLWGQAACAIAESKTSQDQQNAFGQTQHYADTAVQMIASMDTGAKQIQGLVSTLNADRTATTVSKFVPDLRAIENQAASLAKGSSGDESDTWTSLSGSVADCIAQLPPSLQG